MCNDPPPDHRNPRKWVPLYAGALALSIGPSRVARYNTHRSVAINPHLPIITCMPFNRATT
jgi:hypothetical protein